MEFYLSITLFHCWDLKVFPKFGKQIVYTQNWNLYTKYKETLKFFNLDMPISPENGDSL